MNHVNAQQPTAIGWYFLAFKKYFTLQGRARRSEYWFFSLFNLIAYVIFGIVDAILGTDVVIFESDSEIVSISLISVVYSLIALIPGITVSVRRLHDIGRSGWWLWSPLLAIVVFLLCMLIGVTTGGLISSGTSVAISFITLIGLVITIFVFSVLDSQPFTNQYGPNPKAGRFGR